MAFSHHEACPKCRELGKDEAGNNLARYTNGSAFCFSCHHIERAKGWRPKVTVESTAPPNDLTNQFPEENLTWLRKYLKDVEIMDHFKYSPSLRRHVFQHEDYWEARSVNPNAGAKTLSHGQKPFILFGEGDVIVIVEDVVSAIKVSRVTTALPLFGSHLPPDWMVRLVKLKPERIVLWLDANKLLESRGFARRINNLSNNIATSIYTEEDPKVYDDEDILRFLESE